MQNKLIGNSFFTLFIIGIFIAICFFSKSTIDKKINSGKVILQSHFNTYKIQFKDEKSNNDFYNVHEASNFKNYEKAPNTHVKNVINYEQVPEDDNSYILKREIIKNPLVKDYYAQIGIFASKDVVEEVIKVLSLKGVLNENFTSYIERREVNNKTVYLVEVGVFTEQKEAVQFCDNLSKLNIGCIVIE